MSIETANLVLMSIGIYIGIGVLFGLAFISFGAGKIDPAAKTMPLRARLLILPGVAALWPLMLVKWFTQKEPPVS